MFLSHDLFNYLARLDPYQRAIELQNVLVAACEGKRDGASDAKYKQLRAWARDHPALAHTVPNIVQTNHDLGAFWSYIKSYSDQWEPRRQHVRELLRDFIALAEKVPGEWEPISASAWTGKRSAREEAAAAKALLPVAQASIEALIDHLERGRGNGGPPLDEHQEAIAALKGLHDALGSLIAAYDKEAAPSLAVKKEAVEYLGRAAKALKDDPMPFAVSALCMAVCAGAGLPNVAAWRGAATMVIRKQDRT